jgi:hypothetical protein
VSHSGNETLGAVITLKLRQLKRVVDDALERLPGWHAFERDSIVRLAFPFFQGICFYRSSGSDYRPLAHLNVVIAPSLKPPSLNLSEFLRNPNGRGTRCVDISNHDTEFDDIMAEMIHQFRPSITDPLDLQECLRYYEAKAVPTPPEARDLAALHAYYGADARARYWAGRFRAEDARRPGDDPIGRAFISELLSHVEAGNARQWLTEYGEANIERLGLPR